jgi:LacI family transcriptional regulator, galactose operon repressor
MGSLKPSKSARPTIQDVAAQAGVSTATVSRVLNQVGAVDASLAERVRAACEALQYRPNRAARALAGGRSALIGLIVTDIQNPFFMEVVRGVEDTIQRQGYLLVLCNSAEDPGRERRYIEVMCAEPLAGAIVVPTTDRRPILQPFVDGGIPVVAVDRRVQDTAIDTVLLDNTAAAREAVEHLIANGYRRIAMITGPERTTTARERLEGYRLALRAAGIDPDPELERRGPFTQETGQAQTDQLLALRPPVDALLAGNNRLTMGALEAIHEHGLRVPEDIAVISFDEVPWISPGSVSLTMVTQPAYELGATAALRLIQRLQHPGQLARQETVLAHRLQIGDSSRTRRRAVLAAGPSEDGRAPPVAARSSGEHRAGPGSRGGEEVIC